MRAREFITENKTTLNKLYGGNFPDRDESFWDEVRPHEFDNELEVKIMPKYKLAIILQSQYRVEHLDEILDMMDEDQQEILQRYMSDPNLSNKIILLSGDRIIDGNHRALAAAMKGVPINYVDLADLDEQEVTEDTGKLNYIGNCTDDDVIEHLFGDTTGFAQAVEEYGDDFELDDLVVKYDPESDIHSFYYKQQGVTEGFDKEAGAWRDWQLKMLPRKIEMLSRLVKGWVPSEEDHIAAIEAGYDAMKETGDVKDAAKAIADTLKEIQRRQGLAEGKIINTYLWHGSRHKNEILHPRQAVDTGGAAGSNQNAIYATSDPKVAIAMGLTTSGSDTGMFPNDPQMVLFSGDIRKGKYVYLHKLPMNGPDGKPQFVQGGNSREFHSVPDVKQIKPIEIKEVPVNKYLNLIRKATKQDWALRKKYMKNEGVAEDTVDEMALQTYKTMGDFSKPGPFTGADKKLVPHPKNIEKATRFFEQTPFDFRLFFSHLTGTGKYSEHGPMSHDQIRQVFGQDAEEIINGSEDAITVVYVGNKGDAKVMLTPWMMAHRFGHAINAGARNKNWTAWGEAEKYFFQTVNNLLDEHYGKVPATKPPGRNILYQLEPEYNALFNAMGTQRSSKTGQIRRPYEFLYELFAQYLGTGKVTLNPLPTNLGYGRRVFGNPTKFMNIKPEYRDESERKQAADSLAYTMELLFNDVLSDSVGKIFVM